MSRSAVPIINELLVRSRRMAWAAFLAVSAGLCSIPVSPAVALDLFAAHEVTAQFATPDGKPMVDAEVRVYDNLFTKENLADLEEGKDPLDYLNPNSLEVISHAKLESSLANPATGGRYQFERLGYFCADPDSKPGASVFNRTVALKDTWAKVEKKQGGKG